MEELDSELH